MKHPNIEPLFGYTNVLVSLIDIFKIYCADHTYSTLKLRMDTTVEEIIQHASSKLCLGDDLVLCEIKSNGGEIWTIITCISQSDD